MDLNHHLLTMINPSVLSFVPPCHNILPFPLRVLINFLFNNVQVEDETDLHQKPSPQPKNKLTKIRRTI